MVAPSNLYPAMVTGRQIGAICPKGSYLGALLDSANCGAALENGETQGLADFIRGLMQDREKAARMGKAGRAYLKAHFTPEIISRAYLAMIQSMMVGWAER